VRELSVTSNSGSIQPRLLRLGFLILLLGIVFHPVPLAQADLADPPKLVSIKQVTQGPYKMGDVITFELSISGGSPGITRITLVGGCLRTWAVWDLDSNYFPYVQPDAKFTTRSVQPDPEFTSKSRVSAVIDSCNSGIYGVDSIEIQDKTLLVDRWNQTTNSLLLQNSTLRYQVIKSVAFEAPIGTNVTSQLDDRLTFELPSLLSFNGDELSFPISRLTDVGRFFDIRAFGNCSLIYKFPGDLPSSIDFFDSGLCQVRISTQNTVLSFYKPIIVEKSIRTLDGCSTSKANSDVLWNQLRSMMIAYPKYREQLEVLFVAIDVRCLGPKRLKEIETQFNKLLVEIRANSTSAENSSAEKSLNSCTLNKIALQKLGLQIFTNLQSNSKSSAILGELYLRLQSALSSKCVSDVTLADFSAEVSMALKETSKKTITCIKGKSVKKVTAVNPKCPSGYKKR
jgi:hypothetical protein